METKFDFNENPEQPGIKKNASGLFKGIIVFLKSILSFYEDVDKNATVNSIKADISMKGTTAWILICSILIASVGLNANSTPVVIGAMLISPLLGPILGLGFSIATNDVETLKNSFINFLVMVFLSVITAYIFFAIIPINDESSELLSRSSFDIRDVLIAFFGGLALIIAKTKKENISSAIFGVAIATALMPPLCTIGFYLAQENFTKALNAMYLFTINSMYIIVATYFVLKILRFPLINYANSTRRSFINKTISFASLLILIYPIFTFTKVVNKSRFDSQSDNFLKNELVGLPNYDLLLERSSSNYNDGDSKITINTYGQKPLSDETISFLNKKKDTYSKLINATLEFVQDNNNLINSNEFVKELRYRDSIELISKTNEINKLNKRLSELEKLSREKLIFNSLSKEVKIIYPSLKQFEVFETIKTDFNSVDTILVFSLKWDEKLNIDEKIKLNKNIQGWLEFQLDDDVFEIRSNIN
ncbi:MAG: DUF389 domain-containing protein [Cryomorphaceae bacterium]|nr:MAG: DUF389 domain-containing protein [Cryomorphaceae bacterium]